MTKTSEKEFYWYEGLALLLCCIGIQLMSEVLAQWGLFFYSPTVGGDRIVYVAVKLAGVIFLIGILFDAFSDPIIGLWSDKTRTRPSRFRIPRISGRRRPFMFWGSIGMVFTSILFWYPPVPKESYLNFIYGTFIFCLHGGVFFTMCAVPFNALAPEIARSQAARIKIGTWIAAGMIIGLAIASIAPGILVNALDPARHVHETVDPAQPGVEEEDSGPAYSPVGYQRTAMIFAFVSLAFFQFAVWTIRERYHSDKAPPRAPSLTVAKQALGNKLFLKYVSIFFLFNIGLLGVQRILPYWAQLGLEGEEDLVSVLMAPFILTALCALAFTTPLSKFIPVKWLLFISLAIIASGLPFMYLIAVSNATPAAKTIMGGALFGYCGLGQGMIYILFTPLLGEIIDLDEKQSGERREAVYGSLHGLAWKGSQALAVFVAAQSMDLLGNSPERPLGVFIMGPVAGVFGVLGLAVCWTYPVLRVTKEKAEEA